MGWGVNVFEYIPMCGEKSLDKAPDFDNILKTTNVQEQLTRLNQPTQSDA